MSVPLIYALRSSRINYTGCTDCLDQSPRARAPLKYLLLRHGALILKYRIWIRACKSCNVKEIELVNFTRRFIDLWAKMSIKRASRCGICSWPTQSWSAQNKSKHNDRIVSYSVFKSAPLNSLLWGKCRNMKLINYRRACANRGLCFSDHQRKKTRRLLQTAGRRIKLQLQKMA